jgi:hypothetical protein
MNIPTLIVALITLLALVAHTLGGTKESLSLAPKTFQGNKNGDEVLYKNWIQSMCAFQMITVDLLLLTVVLLTMSLTDFIPFEKYLTLSLSVLFFLWGVAWLIQLAFLTKDKKSYLYLSQWAFWFACSGLLFVGSQ